MNNKQREVIANFLLDLTKAILAVFFIGGFVPGTVVTIYHILFALLICLVLFIAAMRILRRYTND